MEAAAVDDDDELEVEGLVDSRNPEFEDEPSGLDEDYASVTVGLKIDRVTLSWATGDHWSRWRTDDDGSNPDGKLASVATGWL